MASLAAKKINKDNFRQYLQFWCMNYCASVHVHDAQVGAVARLQKKADKYELKVGDVAAEMID